MVREGKLNNKIVVYLIYWFILFIVYLPAASAGRVGDFPGWVDAVTNRSFFDYVNRTGSGIPSMYQFTQVVTWVFYQFFGPNAWLWHLLYISMQAINALMLFLFFRSLLSKPLKNKAEMIAFSGTLLFCISPHISEVVVWEPSFHYLLGLMLMLSVLLCLQGYILTLRGAYAWWGGILFFLSTFSLEVFYLTPLFVFSLLVYYRAINEVTTGLFKGALARFILPQLLIFMLHLALLKTFYHQGIAHIGTVSVIVNIVNLSKALKYIFHILFFGRFFNADVRNSVYHFCESWLAITAIYGAVVMVILYVATSFKKFSGQWKVLVLLALWTALSIGLILPLWLPDTGLVIYDRYTYIVDAFIYLFVALLLSNLFRKPVFLLLIVLYALVNLRYTHRVNAYWQQSAYIVNTLVNTFPNDTTKKVLLLNLPECLDGVQMVGTRDDGEFRMLYNAVLPDKIKNEVYDVEAFYMRSPTDGAHVAVVNDSTVTVTLNQWGTWWIYYGYGASSYENKDFKVVMRDAGHLYDVILKKPAEEYLLLYTVGHEWRKVDMSKKNIDQY